MKLMTKIRFYNRFIYLKQSHPVSQ